MLAAHAKLKAKAAPHMKTKQNEFILLQMKGDLDKLALQEADLVTSVYKEEDFRCLL